MLSVLREHGIEPRFLMLTEYREHATQDLANREVIPGLFLNRSGSDSARRGFLPRLLGRCLRFRCLGRRDRRRAAYPRGMRIRVAPYEDRQDSELQTTSNGCHVRLLEERETGDLHPKRHKGGIESIRASPR